jgi:hypothetical protein
MSNTSTFNIWSGMIDRCRNRNGKGWACYGGRGITVDDRWLTFAGFLADMGERPKGMSLDRTDNDGPYSPENCRWATHQEQNRNKRHTVRATYRGETRSVLEWAEIVGIPHKLICVRLARGWDDERALTTPAQSHRLRT